MLAISHHTMRLVIAGSMASMLVACQAPPTSVGTEQIRGLAVTNKQLSQGQPHGNARQQIRTSTQEFLRAVGTGNFGITNAAFIAHITDGLAKEFDLSSTTDQQSIAGFVAHRLQGAGVDEVVAAGAGMYAASITTNSAFVTADNVTLDANILLAAAHLLNIDDRTGKFTTQSVRDTIYNAVRDASHSGLGVYGAITPAQYTSALDYESPLYVRRKAAAEAVINDPDTQAIIQGAATSFHEENRNAFGENFPSVEDYQALIGAVIYDENFRTVPYEANLKYYTAKLADKLPNSVASAINNMSVPPSNIKPSTVMHVHGIKKATPDLLGKYSQLLTNKGYNISQILPVLKKLLDESGGNMGLALNKYHGSAYTNPDGRSQQIVSDSNLARVKALLGISGGGGGHVCGVDPMPPGPTPPGYCGEPIGGV